MHRRLQLLGACVLLSSCNTSDSRSGHGPSPPRALAVLRPAVTRILDEGRRGQRAYERLTELCDGIGHRLSGSPQLEQAVAWALARLRQDGHERVSAQPVMVPRWIRGPASLELVRPRRESLPILALGGSVSTPAQGLEAPLLVVRDEQALKAAGERARGRIVLFNHAMPPFDRRRGTGYGTAARYRVHGARLAAEHGALAALVRSVTASSLRTPHTGAMSDEAPRGGPRVAAAAVTTEDAALLERLARREEVRVRLSVQARDAGLAPSANVLAELRGRERPDEIVVIGGHLDSWDVGQGAHDDGAGCVAAMEALSLLRRLGLRPRRTIRVVLWTNEENGLRGAREYARQAALHQHVAAIEADTGGSRVLGFNLEHDDGPREKAAAAELRSLLSLLRPLGATRVRTGRGSGADLIPLAKAGIVRLGLHQDMRRYFDYHHSAADTLDKVDPVELQQVTTALAAAAFILAELPHRLGATR